MMQREKIEIKIKILNNNNNNNNTASERLKFVVLGKKSKKLLN